MGRWGAISLKAKTGSTIDKNWIDMGYGMLILTYCSNQASQFVLREFRVHELPYHLCVLCSDRETNNSWMRTFDLCMLKHLKLGQGTW
jgi:hypothetical protein